MSELDDLVKKNDRMLRNRAISMAAIVVVLASIFFTVFFKVISEVKEVGLKNIVHEIWEGSQKQKEN